MAYFARSLLAAACAVSVSFAAPALAETTGTTGGGAPVTNYQPSLVLNQLVATGGIFPCRSSSCTGNAAQTIGMVRGFAGNFGAYQAPLAQGQILPISQNTALFSILGTQYGGDGKSTYALPNLVGRTAIGAGQGPGLANFDVGQQVGNAETVLTLAELPTHFHNLPGGGVTSAVGGNQPFGNYQPSLAMNYMIAANGIFPSPSGGGSAHTLIGSVGLFAGSFEVGGWLIADGREVAITAYETLFNLIGTTFGGDGQTTFALPDLRGRAIVGTGQGLGLSNVLLGETLGTAQTTLTTAQMPLHDHTLTGGGLTDATGGGQPFDNHQPGLGLNYIISLQGLFPPRDSGAGELPFNEPYLGEVMAFAGGFAPRGWALAHGQLLSISQNQALFSILGTTYGGDGRTTFALPDLRGRVMLGMGQGFDLGARFGNPFTTLTVDNLPPHAHDYAVAGPEVPEPSTWLIMILGFGMVGALIRRRERMALTQAAQFEC